MQIPVVIADDVDLTIQGMVSVLKADGRFDVRGTARSLEMLLNLLQTETVEAVVVNEWLYSVAVLSMVKNQ